MSTRGTGKRVDPDRAADKGASNEGRTETPALESLPSGGYLLRSGVQ
jgi:hypothetical protein